MERVQAINQHLRGNALSAQSKPLQSSGIAMSAVSLSDMQRLSDYDSSDTRQKIWAMVRAEKELFSPKFGMTTAVERDVAYRQLKRICHKGLISVNDFDSDPHNIFSVHECVAMFDRSAATKMTVQFNLFGGTVLRLGTARHHRLIPAIDSLQQVGCFALTEVGYGNNAVEMESTAEYDELTDEFVINTPTTLSEKFWITNGAMHAHWCIVFAQLIIKGTGYGVHPFLIRIRNDDLRPVPGVKIVDMGHKMGMNGVDNAKLSFKDLRASRDCLLDKVSTVSKGGHFKSAYKSKRDRFVQQSDQLLSGRLCLSAMALGTMKLALTIATRYSLSRKGVGPTGKSDTNIGAYQLHRQAIIPLIAKTFAMNFLFGQAKDVYAEVYKRDSPSPRNAETLKKKCLILCCAVKPYMGWHALDVANVTRERCGGQGYLSENLFGDMIATAHACITAEGDNRVLWEKVAKELLEAFVVAEVYDQLNPQWREASGASTPSEFGSLQAFIDLFKWRETSRLKALLAKMSATKGSREKTFDVWMMKEASLVQSVAEAFTERCAVEAFADLIKTAPARLGKTLDPGAKSVLTCLAELFAYDCVRKDGVYFASSNRLRPADLERVEFLRLQKIEDLSPSFAHLVESFAIPNDCIFAPIAHNWERHQMSS